MLTNSPLCSIWRPLFRNVTQSPLAFCDARTLNESDLVPADRVSPEYAGEIYYVRPSITQRWYWLSEMTPEEVAVFVSFDSAHADKGSPINCKLKYAYPETLKRKES